MAGGAVRRVDVGIEVEPTAPGADLRARLLTWVGDRGDGAGDPSGLELVVERCGVRRRLDPQATVFDAGVVSGDELLLAPPRLAAPAPAARVDDDALVALDIAAGPATGRSLRLPAGRFLLGRDPH